MIALLWALPWLLLPIWAALAVRRRPALEQWDPAAGDVPFVSVVVPARNERHTLAGCMETLLASRYPRYEVIVVDDGSVDGTADVARGQPGVKLVSGEPLPPGWFGKPWACVQGVGSARGELIAFVDADMRLHPELLSRSVAALRQQGAALLSAIPRHVLGSVWERLVMPHFLLLFLLRYPDPARVNRSTRTGDKVALGGWMLIRRDAYNQIGGHEAVRGEVSEDLRLAQIFHAAGHRSLLVAADRFLSVRMYRSLPEIVEGWCKNLAISSRQTVSGPLRWLVPWLLFAGLVGIWLVPPAALLLGSTGIWRQASVAWGALASLGLVGFGGLVCRRLGIPRGYALVFPLGAAIAALIVLRSILRGERVRWKGRDYRIGQLSEGAT